LTQSFHTQLELFLRTSIHLIDQNNRWRHHKLFDAVLSWNHPNTWNTAIYWKLRKNFHPCKSNDLLYARFW